MKQDKFCISKTLIYVVLSFFLGMGILAGINYINNQKLGSKPKATEVKCSGEGMRLYRKYNPKTGLGFKNCNELQQKDKGSIYEEVSSYTDDKYICCKAIKKPTPTPGGRTCTSYPGANWYQLTCERVSQINNNAPVEDLTNQVSDKDIWTSKNPPRRCCRIERMPTLTITLHTNPISTPMPGTLGGKCRSSRPKCDRRLVCVDNICDYP